MNKVVISKCMAHQVGTMVDRGHGMMIRSIWWNDDCYSPEQIERAFRVKLWITPFSDVGGWDIRLECTPNAVTNFYNNFNNYKMEEI